VVCFSHGTYRLTHPIRPRAGQTLIGRDAVLSGARVLRGFEKTPTGWAVHGQRQQGERNGECRGGGRSCTLPDDVVRDGVRLRRVLSRSALRPATFFFDYRHNTIHVFDNPHGHRLEAMVAPTGVLSRTAPAGADVTVKGFVVEHFATRAQHGAIETSSPGWVIADNVVRVNHGAGITSSGDVLITGNTVLRNGQLGIGGTGVSTTVTHNEIGFNNTAGFDPGWEAGGAKWAVTDGLMVRRNRVHDNRGPGLWTDIDAQNTTYAHNFVRNNTHAGIFHEISGDAVIRNNIVTGNGHGFPTWLWGSGILLAGSHGVEVYGNQLARNAEGIGLVQQDRGLSDVDGLPRRLHDIAVHDNETYMGHGESGAVEDNGDVAIFSDPTITWTDNDWYQSGGSPFMWDDDYLTAAEWRDLGHDVGGVFD
jgi:parallel beta-helix repeat protein